MFLPKFDSATDELWILDAIVESIANVGIQEEASL